MNPDITLPYQKLKTVIITKKTLITEHSWTRKEQDPEVLFVPETKQVPPDNDRDI